MGGMIEMLYWDGFVIEKGLDLFLVCKMVMIDFVKELEIDYELVS